MGNIKYLLGYTFEEDTSRLLGIQETDFLTKNDASFYCVHLRPSGESSVARFSTIEEVLECLPGKDLVYRYIEYQGLNHRLILMLNNVSRGNEFYGYRAHYGIDGRWRLFFNTKTDITVQPISPNDSASAYFRDFPSGDQFYLHFSCLQYTLNNYSFENQKALKSMFQKVLGCYNQLHQAQI